MLFVQDESAGIFITGATPSLETGQLIDLQGTTDPGEFAPRISKPIVHILGQAPLPHAELKGFEDLITGKEDCQWVEVKGIVRSARFLEGSDNQLQVDLACGSGRLTAKILVEEKQDFSAWVDAVIRVRGVCTTLFNKKRQLLGVELYTKGMDHVVIETPAPPSPFQISESPVDDLMQFSRNGRFGHRVKVSGTVTFHGNGKFLYVRGTRGALLVQTTEETREQPGDRVEVLGFPGPGDFSAVVQDSSVHKVGMTSSNDFSPWRVDVNQALSGRYDADLVEIDGRVLESARTAEQEILTVQASNLVFTAILERPHSMREMLPNESLVRLRGICVMQAGSQWAKPQSFRLLLRSPADITLLEKPSWWTLARMLWLMAGAMMIAMIACGWVVVISRKNALLCEHRRIQHEILEISGREQRRIAQDLHDGVCQQLGAIAFLTKMLEEDLETKSPEHFHSAREISLHLKEAIGQTRSVAKGLLPVKLEENGLESALEELSASTSRVFRVQCNFECKDPAMLQDNKTAVHLYFIAHEAVSNAVKHAEPAHIWIHLERSTKGLILRIKNDGRAFAGVDSEHPGMGLHIMNYRAQTIGATLAFESNGQGGCQVICSL